MKKITGNLLVLLVAVGILNGWMYLQQPAMIFFPYRELSATPANWGLEYEDIFLNAEDGVQLHGWYLPHHGSSRVLLFFHGNAGNISHRGESVGIFHELGLNVFIIDYRGYGQSQGKPSEPGLYQDASAAWLYLTEKKGFNGKDIVLFGRSLGGAVAAKLASEVQAGGLILESTFSSASDFAKSVFPILSRLVILRYRFEVAEHLKTVTCPVLVLHSPEDEIMPFHLGEKAYQAANQPKIFVKMQGGHNGGFLQSQPGYGQEIYNFIRSYK